MVCPICRNIDAVEDLSFGGGLRFCCAPCGGYFRISSTLDAISQGKSYDVARTRLCLEERRDQKIREQNDLNRPQDLEPTLSSDDGGLLSDSD